MSMYYIILCYFYSYPYIYLTVYNVLPFIHILKQPFTYLSIHPSTYRSIYSNIHPSIHPFINISIYLSIYLTVQQRVLSAAIWILITHIEDLDDFKILSKYTPAMPTYIHTFISMNIDIHPIIRRHCIG